MCPEVFSRQVEVYDLETVMTPSPLSGSINELKAAYFPDAGTAGTHVASQSSTQTSSPPRAPAPSFPFSSDLNKSARDDTSEGSRDFGFDNMV
ncbi:hypothetical protein MBM_03928 [Drepanopeziza brunnea f. sp. 'multigermtubi' MB_m1]|uniref:Uncharacterized protein n=1 Tax=Marssonina brunnea f. sp. multigermtubi (strain MB_m1) TaxID=1072389 RepID=K1WYY3_MARBU|nr:uncharacterized protein MBM_03928 [Drepanopeziza brunnea f. sp. 'multigermtubi' MB_m1]EKD18156.1 hypothetical protein MBM_03928 [Drepanopeziza brunnea f. sp. 'multigermtubi' MB_m1]